MKQNAKINKAQFNPESLYIGSIAKVKKCKHLGFRFWDFEYETVKDFAIFYKNKKCETYHILGTELTSIYDAKQGDYISKDIKPLLEVLTKEEMEGLLNKSGKISKTDLEEFELKNCSDLTL